METCHTFTNYIEGRYFLSLITSLIRHTFNLFSSDETGQFRNLVSFYTLEMGPLKFSKGELKVTRRPFQNV